MGKKRFDEDLLNPCAGGSLPDAIQMIACIELLYMAFYGFHGGFLIAGSEDNRLTFGMMFLICSAYSLRLALLSWTIARQRTGFAALCRWWISSTGFVQFIVLGTTIVRNVLNGFWEMGATNTWAFCGLFVQFYMIWIVWALMKSSEEDDAVVIVNPDDFTPPPGTASGSGNDNEIQHPNEDDTVVIEPSDSWKKK